MWGTALAGTLLSILDSYRLYSVASPFRPLVFWLDIRGTESDPSVVVLLLPALAVEAFQLADTWPVLWLPLPADKAEMRPWACQKEAGF